MVNPQPTSLGETLSAEMPSIAVVMSTYNGAEHVAEQLDSVLAQDVAGCAELSVYVRDDGSKDKTRTILEAYAADGRIHYLPGDNLGVVGSFLDVMSAVPAGVDYVALCDQDDVWHTDKLSRALEVLVPRDQSIPQLYCSEYIFCDAEMNRQGKSRLNQTGVDFNKMLYENMVSGNTTVVNRALVDAVLGAGREGVYCHDWWLALVACALGELTYDDYASLDYRRTGSNVSPTGTGGLSLLRYRLRTFFQNDELACITAQLRKLDKCFGDKMPAEKRAVLRRFLDGNRFSKAFAPVKLRQKPAEEIAVRALFLAGKL